MWMMLNQVMHEPWLRSCQEPWLGLDRSSVECWRRLQLLYDLRTIGSVEEVDEVRSLSDWLGRNFLLSSWMRVWWGFWHFLHRLRLGHCLEKWPGRRQFRQSSFDLIVDIILSRGRDLKWVQTYRGCLSFLHRAQLSALLALVAKDTIGPDLLGGTRLGKWYSVWMNFFVTEETDSDACALRLINPRKSL